MPLNARKIPEKVPEKVPDGVLLPHAFRDQPPPKAIAIAAAASVVPCAHTVATLAGGSEGHTAAAMIGSALEFSHTVFGKLSQYKA